MNVLLALVSLLALHLGVTADKPNECPSKETLMKHKVDKDITPLLKGNTYVDIWRRKTTAEIIDCSMTEYTASDNVLFAITHNVRKDGKSIYFKDEMTENKGESSFNTYMEHKEDGKETEVFDEYNHYFFAEHFALGYISCDVNSRFLRMAVSVKKGKENYKEALESLNKAVEIMNSLKNLMPEEMLKLDRKHCPNKV